MPSSIRGGNYTFQVGSTGSAVLVAQTVLPALMLADTPSTLTIGGGTHAAWVPPFEFFARCFLPRLAQMHANIAVSLRSHGFYPSGGGEIEMQIMPGPTLTGLELLNRSGELRPKVTALVSRIPVTVGERECDVIRRWASQPLKVTPASSEQ